MDTITDPPRQRHSETSAAAADAIRPKSATLREKVHSFLLTRGEMGATDEEIQDLLRMPASTERPRRVELVAMGLVKESRTRRTTRSGRAASVWAAVEGAKQWA
jgi:hypothetical protein